MVVSINIPNASVITTMPFASAIRNGSLVLYRLSSSSIFKLICCFETNQIHSNHSSFLYFLGVNFFLAICFPNLREFSNERSNNCFVSSDIGSDSLESEGVSVTHVFY